MFDQLKNLFQNRRTARYVSRDDIPDEDIQKLISISKISPSADKLYAYKVYALTNSPEGVTKKQALVEFARCGADSPGDEWSGHEINDSLLSGLVFYFTITNSPSNTPSSHHHLSPTKLKRYSTIDASINATMIMMAAESMGYRTAFSAFISDKEASRKILTGGADEEIILAMSVATPNKIAVPNRTMLLVNFKNQKPHVIAGKHNLVNTTANIIVV